MAVAKVWMLSVYFFPWLYTVFEHSLPSLQEFNSCVCSPLNWRRHLKKSLFVSGIQNSKYALNACHGTTKETFSF